uniref:DDE Tnp4 domain-containing protein n=1 Tax=Stomoxys calcitrans TaxID=35570 RepID=A0A1I8PJB3_STOCA
SVNPDFELKKNANDFEKKWNFSFCLGAIDGKHIAIKSKAEYGSFYYNYNGFHSVILLAVVDANYNVVYVNVGSCVSPLRKTSWFFTCNREEVPFVFVADDAFRLTSRMLKLYGERSANANKIFNY